jgi:hypothetical protein
MRIGHGPSFCAPTHLPHPRQKPKRRVYGSCGLRELYDEGELEFAQLGRGKVFLQHAMTSRIETHELGMAIEVIDVSNEERGDLLGTASLCGLERRLNSIQRIQTSEPLIILDGPHWGRYSVARPLRSSEKAKVVPAAKPGW